MYGVNRSEISQQLVQPRLLVCLHVGINIITDFLVALLFKTEYITFMDFKAVLSYLAD
jgi:hypothetical protein